MDAATGPTSFTLLVNGTLTIDQDIIRNNDNSINQQDNPVFYAIARNIVISPNVSRIDGVFVAQPRSNLPTDGNIYTCGNNSNSAILYSQCGAVQYSTRSAQRGLGDLSNTRRLYVRGAFQAKKLYLLRTFGHTNKPEVDNDNRDNPSAFPNSTSAAEIIDFDPSLVLTKPNLPGVLRPTPAAKYDSFEQLPPVLR